MAQWRFRNLNLPARFAGWCREFQSHAIPSFLHPSCFVSLGFPPPAPAVLSERFGLHAGGFEAYEVECRAVVRAFQELKVSHPVVITGDIHTHWANDLLTDFDNPDSRTVASELVCSSISSKGDGEGKPKFQDSMLRENPFVKYFSDRRGYVSCTIGPKIWRTDFRTVDYVSRSAAPLVTPASYILESGRAGLQTV
ncbi:MAG: phosphodiesterase/alkaline phosphatase [Verrucomicrobiales bacterium]|nr:phosphodiesterase/alkaline phosphatase [Verrucomicrobiales bacterium]